VHEFIHSPIRGLASVFRLPISPGCGRQGNWFDTGEVGGTTQHVPRALAHGGQATCGKLILECRPPLHRASTSPLTTDPIFLAALALLAMVGARLRGGEQWQHFTPEQTSIHPPVWGGKPSLSREIHIQTPIAVHTVQGQGSSALAQRSSALAQRAIHVRSRWGD
jgi:hypothetical protein